MTKSTSDRIIATPSTYAKENFFHVQEVGTLKSLKPHISKRQNLNSYLFFTVLEGTGYVTYQNQKLVVSAGDCIWLDCRLPYSHESSEVNPWKLMWVHFHGPLSDSYYRYFLKQNLSFLFHPRSIVPFTDALTLLYQSHLEKSSLMELCSNKYITDIITLCFTENNGFHQEEYTIPEKLKLINNYISEHYHEKISLEDLSHQFFISKYHLSREYKKIYGRTLGQDLTSQRISRAKSLLRFSEDSIESIAQSCGFSDCTYFIKVFKKAENMTPSEYRKKW